VFADHTELVPAVATGQVAMFLFFGLSGYLITSLLTAERATTGRIAIGSFYARRALRLLPALVVFLLAWLMVIAVFGRSGWTTTVPNGHAGTGQSFTAALEGAGAALAYVTNWFELFHVFGGYVAVGHLWSLAVEEQFYLLWAPGLVLLLARGRRVALAGAVLLAVASFADVVLIQHAHSTTSWLFRSTDTRAGVFLAGAALAVWRSGHPDPPEPWKRLRRPVAWAALAVTVWAGWVLAHPASVLTYNAGWIAISVAAPVLTVALADARTTIRPLLPGRVMIYLGRRSYGLYLWHYVWLTWFRDLGLPGIAMALAASLASAELSWQLVEARALRYKRRFTPAPVTGASAAGHMLDTKVPRFGHFRVWSEETR
jgi:peptidoglycan/LPS O-acetylase OafA/YrhL